MRERVARVTEVEPQRGETAKDLLPILAYRMPNRIYCSQNGLIGRTVFYEDMMERFPFNMYWEVLSPDSDGQYEKVERSETLVGIDVNALESELKFVRGRFDLKGDLLLKPDTVHAIDMPHLVRPNTSFIHTLALGKQHYVAQYHLSETGATLTRMQNSQGPIQEVETIEIGSIPAGIVEHSEFFRSKF